MDNHIKTWLLMGLLAVGFNLALLYKKHLEKKIRKQISFEISSAVSDYSDFDTSDVIWSIQKLLYDNKVVTKSEIDKIVNQSEKYTKLLDDLGIISDGDGILLEGYNAELFPSDGEVATFWLSEEERYKYIRELYYKNKSDKSLRIKDDKQATDYISYLIHELNKADSAGDIRRKFGTYWKLLSIRKHKDVITFLLSESPHKNLLSYDEYIERNKS